MIKKKRLLILVLCLAVIIMGSCGQNETTTGELVVSESEYSNVELHITSEELEKIGILPGDSVNIEFSNGFEIEDIPLYTGYYGELDEPMLVAYPGYEFLSFCYNMGVSSWKSTGMTNKDTGRIMLAESGKYRSTEEALSQKRSNSRDDFESDEIFANFRALKGGKLKDNLIFRSSSPCNNIYERAQCTDSLIGKYGVNYVLNLADNDEEYAEYTEKSDFCSDNYAELYDTGRVYMANMPANYRLDEYKTKLGDSLKVLSQTEGVYLMHCTEGKDRTGFSCAVIEALAGASYDEIRDDYMETYDNYFHINRENNPKQYNAVIDAYFIDIMKTIADIKDDELLQNADYEAGARKYLKACGLTDDDIVKLINTICAE